MLTKRIIPCLDVDHGRVVKGKKFKDIQDVADPVELGRYYSEQGADELVFYDITASYEKRDIFINVVEKVAEAVRIPFTIGGGIRTTDDFRQVLMAGADKVSVNSAAVKNPQLIMDAALRFGNQCVVLSIDAKRNGKGSWDVFTDGGRHNTGYDIALNKKLSETLTIPVIASGGAGKMADFSEVLKAGADAALAASVFHYKEILIPDLKQYLSDEGLPMRLV